VCSDLGGAAPTKAQQTTFDNALLSLQLMMNGVPFIQFCFYKTLHHHALHSLGFGLFLVPFPRLNEMAMYPNRHSSSAFEWVVADKVSLGPDGSQRGNQRKAIVCQLMNTDYFAARILHSLFADRVLHLVGFPAFAIFCCICYPN
jgi:hypothetical protein